MVAIYLLVASFCLWCVGYIVLNEIKRHEEKKLNQKIKENIKKAKQG